MSVVAVKSNTTFYAGASYRTGRKARWWVTPLTVSVDASTFNNKVSDRLKIGILTGITYTINNFVPSGGSSSGQGGFGVAQTRSLPIFPVFWEDALPQNQRDIYSFNPYFNAYGNFREPISN